MSLTTDLLDGIAGLIIGAGIAVQKTAPDVYLDSDTAISWSLMPTQPDRCIVLTDFPVSDDPAQALGQIGVQLRIRGLPGDPRDAQELRDSIYELLQGLINQFFGSVHVIQCNRRSSIPNGQDDSRRFEYFENYYCDVDLPVTANRPF